jgi:hypothetical protein
MLEILFYTQRVTSWSFLTNHARALLCIAQDPGMRLRDIADALSVTERAAYGIVTDLVESGYVSKERNGRRNRYQVRVDLPLPDSTPAGRTIGELVDLLVTSAHRSRLRRQSAAGQRAAITRS